MKKFFTLLLPLVLLTASCEKDLPITDVDIEWATVSMGVNDVFKVRTVVTLNDGKKVENPDNLIWTSSDESLFTVKNGIITSYKEGKGTVTVSSKDGTYKDSCPVVCIEYLYFTAVDEPATVTCSSGRNRIPQFSYDMHNWKSFNQEYAKLDPGQTVYLRAYNPDGYAGVYGRLSVEGNPICGGNIMSLISYEDIVTEIPVDFCFQGFFSEVTVRGVPRLPATKLKPGCYASMFERSGITEPPVLPATKLERDCYNNMFAYSKLEKMPELIATELAPGCYHQMFYLCKNLKEVTPLTYAKHIPERCFEEMFHKSGITTAPKIKAETTDRYACYRMFYDCAELKTSPSLDIDYPGEWAFSEMFCYSALTIAPKINVKRLSPMCFGYMFSHCASMTTPSELPYTELAPGCYSAMFYDCKNLLTAPDLPATKLEDGCYSNMFENCVSLQTAPELPALELTEWCYAYMFKNCYSLTKAPELNALHLVNGCYNYIFYGCRSLTYLKAMFLDPLSNDYLSNWIWSTAHTADREHSLDAVLVKNPDNIFDENYIWLFIPKRWKIVDYQP